MQTVSSGWGNKTALGNRRISYGALFAWMRTTATGVRFFTISQSTIGGPDMIKGAGDFVAFFDKYLYDDHSQYVMSMSVKRNIGQYPYGVIMAEADVELDNTSKKFLPNYDTTIGSGILPNRPIKLSIGIEDEFVKLFTGFSTQPAVTLNNRLIQMHAYDVFNYFNSFVSTISGAFVNAPFHNIVASGMQEMGFSSSQYILDKSLQQNIGYLATYGKTWGSIFKQGADAEQALMFADENGLPRFWNRQHFLTASGVVKFQLSYSKISDIKWQNTPIINDVIVKSKPRAVSNKKLVWRNSSSIELLAGADTEVFVDFKDDFGELPVTTVDIPLYITSATTSRYATNANSDGSGLALNSYIYLKTAYSFGTTYKLVFNNSYTSSIYLTELRVYGTPAEVTSVIEERYQDANSIEHFGRNPSNNFEPLVIENDLIQDASTAHSLAYTLVNEYKSPGKRYLCPVAVQSDPALQIGDAGLILINDTNEVKNVFITGITNSLDRNADYNQTLEVEERDIRSYFTINQSTIGGPDSIAP